MDVPESWKGLKKVKEYELTRSFLFLNQTLRFMHKLQMERDQNTSKDKNGQLVPDPVANFSILPLYGMRVGMCFFDRIVIEAMLRKVFGENEKQLSDMVKLT